MPPRTPLIRPDAYFAREDRPSMVVGTLAVLGVVASTAAVIYWSSRPMLQRLLQSEMARRFTAEERARIEAELLAGLTRDVILVAAVVLVGWLLFAGLVALAVRALDGEGGLVRSLALTGEAHLPVLVLLPARVVVLWLLLQATVDPTELGAPVGSAMVFWGTLPLLVLSVVSIVWKGLVVGFGLTDIDTVRAVTVGVSLAAVTSPLGLLFVLLML